MAGGDPQAQYERHRQAFLAQAIHVDDPTPAPAGLGSRGLAGLLTADAGAWIVHIVAATPRRWTGAADSRVTALLDAYRLILRSASPDHAGITQ
jgi:hypothetical protein